MPSCDLEPRAGRTATPSSNGATSSRGSLVSSSLGVIGVYKVLVDQPGRGIRDLRVAHGRPGRLFGGQDRAPRRPHYAVEALPVGPLCHLGLTGLKVGHGDLRTRRRADLVRAVDVAARILAELVLGVHVPEIYGAAIGLLRHYLLIVAQRQYERVIESPNARQGSRQRCELFSRRIVRRRVSRLAWPARHSPRQAPIRQPPPYQLQ